MPEPPNFFRSAEHMNWRIFSCFRTWKVLSLVKIAEGTGTGTLPMDITFILLSALTAKTPHLESTVAVPLARQMLFRR